MTKIHRTLRERFGFPIGVLLLFAFCWFVVMNNIHRDSSLGGLLYPLHWLLFFPFGREFLAFLQPFAALWWWAWVEISIMFLCWLMLFFLVRGILYFLSAVEGLSMWQAFAIALGLGFLLLFLILLPVMDQLDVWWKAWPQIRQPSLPGVS